MQKSWFRNATLAVSGAAIAVAGHFAGVDDYMLLAATLATIALVVGVARDRLAIELAKVDQLSSKIAELQSAAPPPGPMPLPLPLPQVKVGAQPDTTRHEPSVPRADQSPALPPGARIASINRRPGIIFGDGTVIVHTLAGYRQFQSEADALFFLGASPTGKLNS